MGHSVNIGTTSLGMTSIATISNDALTIHLPVEPKLEEYMTNTTLTVAGIGLSSLRQQVEVQRWGIIYVYSSPMRLFLSYGIALFFAFLAVLLGYLALIRNGVAGDRGFMQVLMTTRNPELDNLIEEKNWDGRGNLPRSLNDAKLRYGRSIDGTREYFGTDFTVTRFSGKL